MNKKFSRVRVIVSGPRLEVYESEKAIPYGFSGRGGRKRGQKQANEKTRKQTMRKARNQIQRLCQTNFHNNDKFITLTFRDGSIPDVTNIVQGNHEFQNFMQRLRRRYKGFRYIAVIQFQDTNHRQAVHYHMICNLPYIPQVELSSLWPHGTLSVNRLYHIKDLGFYLTRHMLEDPNDLRLQGRKSYLTSHNLKKPVTLRGDTAVEIAGFLKTKKEVFANSYMSEHHGKISYKDYNLNNLKCLDSAI